MRIPIGAALALGLLVNAYGFDWRPWPARNVSLTLTRDGRPAAAIVVAADPSRSALSAAQELREHVRLISGADLPIVVDGDAVPAGTVRILVGESAATRQLGLTGADFQPQEYLVRFRPDTLLLMGRDKADPALTAAVQVAGSPKTVAGRFGNARHFDGVQDALMVSESGFADSAGTLEAWVSLGAATAPLGTILRLDGASPWTYQILQRVGTDRVQYISYDGKNGTSVVSEPLAVGWHHLVATHSAETATLELFVDGRSQGKAPYVSTTCANRPLMIGGIVRDGQAPGNPFAGRIDEVRVRGTVCPPPPDWATRTGDSTGATVVLSLDEPDGTPIRIPRSQGSLLSNVALPDFFDDQGTLYAVYDFLERFCGVRWFNPTESGTVCPAQRTLTVQGREVCRQPRFTLRSGTITYGFDTYDVTTGTLWPKNTEECHAYEREAYPELARQFPDLDAFRAAKARRVVRFLHRMRVGGERNDCNHSLYGFYDRFWEPNPANPKLFEGQRPEFFAQGYPGKPPQLCYTSRALVEQLAKDARDYYDGKKTGAKLGIFWNPRLPNRFPLEPMDNPSFCKCAACQAWLNQAEEKSEFFSNGKHSDYFFQFINAVACELRKTHPDRGLITLAYMTHTAQPMRVKLDPSVAVQYCFACNRLVYDKQSYEHELDYLKAWGKESGKRPMYLWLYYTFPWEAALNGKFNCFPGFFAHELGRQFRLFDQYGYRGMFHCGYGQDVEAYLTYKFMLDPTLDVDRLLDEYFAGLYGAAAEPMKQFYLEVERIYGDRRNYPPDVASGRKQAHTHQTDDIAWRWLGTDERMQRLAGYMAAAKAAADTPVVQRRVALFDAGIWSYMTAGKARFAERQKTKATLPIASARVLRVPAADGDPAKVDWEKALNPGSWLTTMGSPTSRQIEARLAHDGTFLYVRLRETAISGSLQTDPDIYQGDDWELFVAPARGGNVYRQLSVNPAGKWEAFRYEPLQSGRPWDCGAKIVNTLSADRKIWTVQMAIPLKVLLPAGAVPGKPFFANLYRNVPGGDSLAWSATFSERFHDQARLGQLTLEN